MGIVTLAYSCLITIFSGTFSVSILRMENYTKIFRENGGYILSRTNMKTIQEILPEENFLRIHRSYIVPIEKIEMFSKKKIKLIGKEIFLPIGRLYANHIYDTLISRNSGHIFPNS